MQDKVVSKLQGSYYVVPTGSALREAGRLFPKARPFFELKAQTTKLAYFPGSTGDPIVDLDWGWLDGAKEIGGLRIGELRIDDAIGGFNNLRVIFLPVNAVLEGDPLPRIWILSVQQKKKRRFSPTELKTFHSRAGIILLRHYP